MNTLPFCYRLEVFSLLTTSRYRQFALYVVSGGLAFVADYGSYIAMIRSGVWYVSANIYSNIVGFFITFLLHKYLTFQTREKHMEHFIRYCIMTAVSVAGQTLVLYLMVQSNYVGEEIAKILSMGVVVFWNYFLYKFFVYV